MVQTKHIAGLSNEMTAQVKSNRSSGGVSKALRKMKARPRLSGIQLANTKIPKYELNNWDKNFNKILEKDEIYQEFRNQLDELKKTEKWTGETSKMKWGITENLNNRYDELKNEN